MAEFSEKSDQKPSATTQKSRKGLSSTEGGDGVLRSKALESSLSSWFSTNSKSGVQTKLEVGEPHDSFEQEADSVADRVVGMTNKSDHARVNGKEASSLQLQNEDEEPLQAERIQRQTDEEDEKPVQPKLIQKQSAEEEEKPIQAKFIQRQFTEEEGKPIQPKRISAKSGTSSNDVLTGFEDKLNSSTGQGSPLPDSTRASMESSFGADFKQVRVHTDSNAVQMNKEIGAKAFTHGNDIYFNSGKFDPESSSGKQLLAHELTHTLQQKGKNDVRLIQRAEVDDRSDIGLTDIESDVDTKVNSELAAARAESGTPIDITLFLQNVMKRLGKGAISPIEDFIEALPVSKRRIPSQDLSDTKYSGVDAVNQFYKLHTLNLAHVVGSSVKIHSICVGADKLGHFFQEGYNFFLISSWPGNTVDDAKKAGRAWEIGIQGLGATGVYSNADLAANLSGMQFYNDLKANPSLIFSIKNYITSQWNEQSNPSFYSPEVGAVVWSNLLTGTWSGGFTSELQQRTVPISVNLVATADGKVTGIYFYPTANPTNFGTIKNGKITMKTTSVSGISPGAPALAADPVSGISIQFDWDETWNVGKAILNSKDEQTIEGTWGNDSSESGGGVWFLKKT